MRRHSIFRSRYEIDTGALRQATREIRDSYAYGQSGFNRQDHFDAFQWKTVITHPQTVFIESDLLAIDRSRHHLRILVRDDFHCRRTALRDEAQAQLANAVNSA